MNLGPFCCYLLRCDKVKTRVAEAAGAAIGLSVRQQQHGPTAVAGGRSDLQHPTVLQESSINENVNNLSVSSFSFLSSGFISRGHAVAGIMSSGVTRLPSSCRGFQKQHQLRLYCNLGERRGDGCRGEGNKEANKEAIRH